LSRRIRSAWAAEGQLQRPGPGAEFDPVGEFHLGQGGGDVIGELPAGLLHRHALSAAGRVCAGDVAGRAQQEHRHRAAAFFHLGREHAGIAGRQRPVGAVMGRVAGVIHQRAQQLA